MWWLPRLFRRDPPPPVVCLPQDAEFQDESPVNWWYWNGHLTTDKGDRFGFMLVVFGIGFPELEAFYQVADFALTLDDQRPSYRYVQHFHLREPHKISDGYEFSFDHGAIQAKGDGYGHATLHGRVDDLVLDLEVKAIQDPVLHWGGRLKKFTFGGNTFYYSRANLTATGTLNRGGQISKVSGASWFDRQWGELGPIRHEKYQWFGIQLDDDSEIILLVFEGDPEHRDSLAAVTRNGVSTPIPPQTYELSHRRIWKSPRSGREYPMGWNLKLNEPRAIDLIIEPVLDDQEFVGTSAYWEGQCNVLGDRVGHAFVEMHGRLDYLSPEGLQKAREKIGAQALPEPTHDRPVEDRPRPTRTA